MDETDEQKKFDQAARAAIKFALKTDDADEMMALIDAAGILGGNLFTRITSMTELYRRSTATMREIQTIHVASGEYCIICDDGPDFPFTGEEGVGNNPACTHYSRTCYVCKRESYPCRTRQLADKLMGTS